MVDADVIKDVKLGEHDVLTFLKPDTLWGALIYLAVFVLLALLVSRLLRAAVHASMTRKGHIDRTTISFLQQFGTVLIWVVVLILYAHLIPMLRSMGTALLAGAGVVSVVLGLAAQSTLGNLVAGISIAIYRPFRLGDTLQVTAPTGTDIGVVELISLGYTTLRAPDGHMIVLPNAIAASQVTINLNTTYAPWPIGITIRLSRDADVEAARKLALSVAAEIARRAGGGRLLSDQNRPRRNHAGTAIQSSRRRGPGCLAIEDALDAAASICRSEDWFERNRFALLRLGAS